MLEKDSVHYKIHMTKVAEKEKLREQQRSYQK